MKQRALPKSDYLLKVELLISMRGHIRADVGIWLHHTVPISFSRSRINAPLSTAVSLNCPV